LYWTRVATVTPWTMLTSCRLADPLGSLAV
jgi:hypothetical protein